MQFYYLIFIFSIGEIQIPLPVFCFDWCCVQCNFKTSVLDVSCVDILTVDAGNTRNADRHDLIFGVFFIISEIKTDSVRQEAPVQTYFPCIFTFGLQII